MRKWLTKTAAALAALVLLFSCEGEFEPLLDESSRPSPSDCRRELDEGKYSSAVVLLSLGYNNLSGELSKDIDDFASGYLPLKHYDGKAVFVFSHQTASYGDYSTPVSPVLYRLYSLKGGGVVKDTVKVYPATELSASALTIEDVLNTVRKNCDAASYGVIFSSHASGWLPSGYDPSTEPGEGWFFLSPEKRRRELVPTKSIGVQGEGTDGFRHQIEMEDFAQAIPYTLDYIVFDACLCGSVELLYSFRRKCRYIVASPTEVLTDGFAYGTMCDNLLNTGTIPEGLITSAREYFNQYSSKNSSATISVYDCSKADTLASFFRKVMDRCASVLPSVAKGSVQDYNYAYDMFYDMRDIVRNAGVRPSVLDSLDAILSETVLYKAATPKFITTPIDTSRVCGLSMYLPYSKRSILNEAYGKTQWNQAVGVLRGE